MLSTDSPSEISKITISLESDNGSLITLLYLLYSQNAPKAPPITSKPKKITQKPPEPLFL
jgi:hypothetical protein